MSSVSIRVSGFEEIADKAIKLGKILPVAAQAIVNRDIIEATNFAKNNAPWTDRTGNARQSIDYHVEYRKNLIRFYIFIGVYYGVFLELCNMGKYRILRPTATIFENKIKQDVKRLKVKL